jgi:dihydrodipicolinate synthase/N-acetylneuraminate lyase
VRVGNEELVDPIVLFGGRGLFAATAAFLGAVFRQWLLM